MARERVQVQGLGGAVPGIQPTIQRAGQYSVQVQRAGRNKLMDLADALGQVNPVLQQYGQLQGTQYKLGLEQAALVEEKQEIEQLKKTKDVGFFDPLAMNARNRGVRDGLLKRYISNTMVPNLSAKTDELIDVQKYTEDEDFYEAVDNEIAKEWQGLVKQVGERIANTTASKALWNTVAPRYRAELISEFEKAKQDFIEDNNGLDLITQLKQSTASGSIDVVGLELIAEQREAIMVEQGITNPAIRQKILLDGYTAQLDTLITKDKFKDARSFVTAMELMKVNGRRVFGSAQSVKSINDFITTLEAAEAKQGTVSKTTKQQNFSGFYESALIGLYGMQKFGGAVEPNQISALKTSLQSLSTELTNNPKALDEVVSSIVESNNPVAAYENKLSELSQSPDAPDLALELYMGNRSRLNSIREDVLVRPRQPLNLDDDYKKQQEEEFLEWAETQTVPPTVKDFILKQKKDYVSWDELDQLGIEAEERGAILNSTYYKGVDSSVGKMIRNETENAFAGDFSIEDFELEEMYRGTSGREFQRSATERIQEGLKNAAPKDDKETIKILNQLEQEEKERWLRIVNAKRDSLNMRPETEVVEGEVPKDSRAKPEEEIKQVRTKELRTFGKDVAYKSLMQIKRGVPVRSVSRQVIEDDRRDMEEKNYRAQQRLSYYNFGLSSYSREGVQKVAALDLDTDDVILFGSLSESEMKLDEWAAILSKDAEGKKLTPEEEKTAEQYIELGIETVNDLVDFGIVQQDLILRPRDAL